MDYESMTVAELKEILKARGLKVSGKKAELIQRLSENETTNSATAEPQTSDEENKSEEDFVMEDADDFEEEFYQDEWDVDEEYAPKQKPSLDDDTKAALMIRKTQRATMPKFRRQEWFRYYRLARTGWRKPNGYQSKQRLNMKYLSLIHI